MFRVGLASSSELVFGPDTKMKLRRRLSIFCRGGTGLDLLSSRKGFYPDASRIVLGLKYPRVKDHWRLQTGKGDRSLSEMLESSIPFGCWKRRPAFIPVVQVADPGYRTLEVCQHKQARDRHG